MIQRILFFVGFALIPGLAYQWIQDYGRPDSLSDGMLEYVFGIAPNALGGVSLTAGFIIISVELFFKGGGRDVHLSSGLLALGCLWAWEFGQIYFPNGTFDWHDLIWTVPGVLLSVGAANLILGSLNK